MKNIGSDTREDCPILTFLSSGVENPITWEHVSSNFCILTIFIWMGSDCAATVQQMVKRVVNGLTNLLNVNFCSKIG